MNSNSESSAAFDSASMDFSEAEAQRLIEELLAKVSSRPVRGRYPVAREGSITERGGVVAGASGGVVIDGSRVALVGDTVRYPDGTVAQIVSGAGAQWINLGRCVALVGSELDNGDRIIGPAHEGMVLTDFADGERIKGLFDKHYVPPQVTKADSHG